MRSTQDINRSRVETKFRLKAGDVPSLLREIPADLREEYAVRTLYFDRPDGSLARHALAHPLHCTKVRARQYRGSAWVWFEVKSRDGCWTRKSRLRLTRSDALRLIFGAGLPAGAAFFVEGDDERDARAYFDEACRGALVPLGAVSAFRRSFQLVRDLVRITLDLDIGYHRPSASGPGLCGPLLWREPEAVLELKHLGQLPPCCLDLVSGLRPSIHSKFRSLVQSLSASDGERDRVDRR
jgi:hypothetical protein